MTDDKITRAEKLIKTLHAYCFCSQTTYRAMGYKFCEDDFICLKELIDTINLQKAEIERLEDKENKKGLVCQVKIDGDKLEDIKNRCLEQIEYNIKEIQDEAIKEFTEKLKEAKVYSSERHENIVPVAVIDWIVKEMTENDFKG